MPGRLAMKKPKAFNRHFYVWSEAAGVPEPRELSEGISSRGVTINETTEEYFYMSGRGTADVESSSQTTERTFTGNRFLGDDAQDMIFITMMYDLGIRQVEYIEYYDDVPDDWEFGNARKGIANIRISDDGGGDAGSRESIGFSLLGVGIPQLGNVAIEDGLPMFTPLDDGGA